MAFAVQSTLEKFGRDGLQEGDISSPTIPIPAAVRIYPMSRW